MFDTGFWEYGLIAVIVLIVIGPEKMPALAKSAGKYVGKLKRFIAKIQDDVKDEFDVNSLKNDLNINDSGNILDIVEEIKEVKVDVESIANDSKKVSKDE